MQGKFCLYLGFEINLLKTIICKLSCVIISRFRQLPSSRSLIFIMCSFYGMNDAGSCPSVRPHISSLEQLSGFQ
jgi:hypothetical protein